MEKKKKTTEEPESYNCVLGVTRKWHEVFKE